MNGFSLFQRRAKTATIVSIMLLPEQILLAISGEPVRFLNYPIPLGETWSRTLQTLFREKKLLNVDVRVVLTANQYQQVSVERPEMPDAELVGALPWTIKDFVSEPVSQLAIDYYDSVTSPQSRPRIQVICTPKSRITEWLAALQPIAELTAVNIDELALAALFSSSEKLEVLLYQLPEKELLLLAFYKGQLCFSRALRGFIPLVQLSPAEYPTHLIDSLMLELQRSFDYLQSQLKLPEVSVLNLAIGLTDQTESLIVPLKQYLGITVQAITTRYPLPNIEFLPLLGALQEKHSA